MIRSREVYRGTRRANTGEDVEEYDTIYTYEFTDLYGRRHTFEKNGGFGNKLTVWYNPYTGEFYYQKRQYRNERLKNNGSAVYSILAMILLIMIVATLFSVFAFFVHVNNLAH